MTLAALLARYGIASMVVELDSTYCEGSRAICMSRRSQEIFAWVGADGALVEKGLSWVGGRSYFRDREVLHFEMPSEPTQRFAPMVNIQQFYAEEFAHKAALGFDGLVDVRWSSKVVAVRPQADGAVVEIESADGHHTVWWPVTVAAARCVNSLACNCRAHSMKAVMSLLTWCKKQNVMWNAWPGLTRHPTPARPF
jgi:3-(3-hydroxy-phenyl)propionate hydroxylase